MKQLTIVGVGVGPDSVTPSAHQAIERAQVLFGAPRLLQEWSAVQKTAYSYYTAAKILPVINNRCDFGGGIAGMGGLLW